MNARAMLKFDSPLFNGEPENVPMAVPKRKKAGQTNSSGQKKKPARDQDDRRPQEGRAPSAARQTNRETVC